MIFSAKAGALMSRSIFTGGDHIGIVTRAVDAAVRKWSDRYGVGPWEVYSYDASTMAATYCDASGSFPMLAALCSLADGFRLELIQPLSDAGPYHASLLAHDDADHLHHIRLAALDPAGARAMLARNGHGVVFDAAFAGADATGPRLHARYFDTVRELGFLLEVVERPESFVMPEPTHVYPSVSPGR
jgi:glyoxalase/bleomycin resistance protein/dioxygenase superfamily protein